MSDGTARGACRCTSATSGRRRRTTRSAKRAPSCCRFRQRGTESLRESGVQQTRGGAERGCGWALGRLPAPDAARAAAAPARARSQPRRILHRRGGDCMVANKGAVRGSTCQKSLKILKLADLGNFNLTSWRGLRLASLGLGPIFAKKNRHGGSARLS